MSGRSQLPNRAAGIAAALALGLAGCTLLVDRAGSQCASDNDCNHFSPDAICAAGACVLPGAADGSAGDVHRPAAGVGGTGSATGAGGAVGPAGASGSGGSGGAPGSGGGSGVGGATSAG